MTDPGRVFRLPTLGAGRTAPVARRRVAAATAVLAAVVAAWPAGPARSDGPVALGWWARTQPGPLVPVPELRVPPGGLYVSSAGAEPLAVSALRFEFDPAATAGDLILRLESSQGVVALGACVSPVRWAQEPGGPYSSAPPADCTLGSAAAAVTGSEVRIPTSALATEGELNVVLLPAENAVFDAVFAPPGDSALTVTEPVATTSTTSTTMSDTFGDGDFGAGFDPAPTPFDPGPPPATTFGGFTPAPAPNVIPPVAPSVPPTPDVQAGRPLPTQPAAATNPRVRFVALLVAFDCLLYWLWLRRRGAQAAAGDTGPVKGIGRFARVREGSAPRI